VYACITVYIYTHIYSRIYSAPNCHSCQYLIRARSTEPARSLDRSIFLFSLRRRPGRKQSTQIILSQTIARPGDAGNKMQATGHWGLVELFRRSSSFLHFGACIARTSIAVSKKSLLIAYRCCTHSNTDVCEQNDLKNICSKPRCCLVNF
jgi:hypothetical protein